MAAVLLTGTGVAAAPPRAVTGMWLADARMLIVSQIVPTGTKAGNASEPLSIAADGKGGTTHILRR